MVDASRVELGYDYCLKEECQQLCLERVELAAVGINKAADYYTRADEVLPPSAAPMTSMGTEEDPEAEARPPRPARPPGEEPKRTETTLERLRRREAELDDALKRSYKRFLAGAITAREMDSECDRLVDGFNDLVRSENIRYRSMLRHPSNRSRSGQRGRRRGA